MKPAPDLHGDWLSAIDAWRDRGQPPETIAAAARPGFAVYVNTGLRALVEALAANHPAVARRVGEARFRGLAIEHALRYPATDSRLFLYGAAFPGHLRSGALHEDAVELAAIAEVDRAWMQAHVAPDAPAFDPEGWSRQPPPALAASRLRLAPATFWLRHADLPLWDLWTAARQGGAGIAPSARGAQAVLITRPGDEVLTCEVDPAACAFLSACREGLALADAAEAALGVAPQADLQALLSRLFTQGAFADGWAPVQLEAEPT